jgi:hypothetical protein
MVVVVLFVILYPRRWPSSDFSNVPLLSVVPTRNGMRNQVLKDTFSSLNYLAGLPSTAACCVPRQTLDRGAALA